MQDPPDLYYLIGEQKETYAATDDPNGATVLLKNSKWIVNKTSYLTGLSIASGSEVTAAKGYNIAMTVDGVATPISPGAYKGKIVLNVAASK
jgi:hypothetical protein